MIYLASPYSDPDPDPTVRETRYRLACEATAELLRSGRTVFSPIVHGHPLADFGLPTDWQFWAPHAREWLARCDEVHVLTLDGYERSVGVAEEIKVARSFGVPVHFATCAPTRPVAPRESQARLFVRPDPERACASTRGLPGER
jgi:hypothetical protein